MPTPGLRKTYAGVILGNASTRVAFSDATVAATGSDATDAALLTAAVNHVTGADDTTGVILPTGAAGRMIDVYNAASGKQLNVYPPSGGTINGGSEDAAIKMDSSSFAVFICMDGTNWGAQFTYNPV